MKFSFAHVIPFVVSVLASLKSPVHAAVDIFLKIDGIKGESQDSKHAGEIDVLAWSWQLSSRPPSGGGSGGGASVPVIRPISILKYTDQASTELIGRLVSGEHSPTARLTVRKAGAQPLEYLKIDLKDVLITSISNGGSETDDGLKEQVFLSFREVCITYTPQNPDGSPGASTMTCWDLQTGTP